jgi:CheY-like chemotaxis protein
MQPEPIPMSNTLTVEQHSTPGRSAILMDRVSGLHVLIADGHTETRTAREQQLLAQGHRVSVARTAFEAIVKASCHVPDLVLLDGSLPDIASTEAGEFLMTCPLTAHIPVVRLSPRRMVPQRVLADLRRRARV